MLLVKVLLLNQRRDSTKTPTLSKLRSPPPPSHLTVCRAGVSVHERGTQCEELLQTNQHKESRCMNIFMEVTKDLPAAF